MIELLNGDEAVALAAMHAGIGGAFSYPGTPATEILEYVAARASLGSGWYVGANESVGADVVARWSTNEKVAYEAALGMSFVGRRALVSMKHVGLNVAADPFMSSSLTGVNGGLVLAVADDPGMHSSQNEQDSRHYAHFAQLPLYEPFDQQTAYDMTREAFDVSERFGIPVVLRLVTRLAHSRADVCTRPAVAPPVRARASDWREWTLIPVNARKRYARLLRLQPDLRNHAAQSEFNRLTLRGPRGVIVTGLAANYFAEAASHFDDALSRRAAAISDDRDLRDAGRDSRNGCAEKGFSAERIFSTAAIGDANFTVLKLGVYPIPAQQVRALVDHCDEITVIEEGYPFVERQLRGLMGVAGKAIHGKHDGTLPAQGELTTDIVRRALRAEPQVVEVAPDDLPNRPPQLCSGCPHCDTFRAVVDAAVVGTRPFYFSDIGCYSLAALPPYNAIDTCVDMGASIGMAIGAARAGAHPVIATIGDSTFIHSGMTGLVEAVHEDANITVIVLDNALVAMTGGQSVFATGDDLLRIIRGLGVDERHLVPLNPAPGLHESNVELMRREINHRGLSVIVAQRACIHAKRRAKEQSTVGCA